MLTVIPQSNWNNRALEQMNIKTLFFYIILLSFLLFACQKINSPADKTVIENSTSHTFLRDNNSLFHVDSLTELNTNFSPGGKDVFIVTNDYEKNVLNLKVFNSDFTQLKIKKVINYKLTEGNLSASKYNSSEAYYPIQFKSDFSSCYFFLFKSNEMEDEFSWCKLFEYDLLKDSLKEVLTLGENYAETWKFVEEVNKIYVIDILSKSLISVDLNKKRFDTIYTANSISNADFLLTGDSLKICFVKNRNEIVRLSIDTRSDLFKEETLIIGYDEYSSIKNDQIVIMVNQVTSGNPKEVERIILYEGKHATEYPYNFANFNSFWVDENHFLTLEENYIKKFDSDLRALKAFKLPRPYIYEILDSSVFVQTRPAGTDLKQYYILSRDLTHAKYIGDFEGEEIVVIGVKINP
jgi:hypothetical protein